MQTLIARGYTFTYQDVGAGEPIVFVHGSVLDCRYWGEVIDTISLDFRCIAPSRRYHWPIPKDCQLGEYNALDQAEDVIAFIEALGLGRVHLVGHSYGGYLCARIAGLRSDLIKSLVLIEPGGTVEGLEKVRSLSYDQDEALKMVLAGETRKGVAKYLNSVCGLNKWEESPLHIRAITLENSQSLVLQMKDKTRPPLTSDLLGAITVPTLVMCGALSPSPFPEVSSRVTQLIPGAEYVEIPNASHLINFDNFEMFVDKIGRFIAAN